MATGIRGSSRTAIAQVASATLAAPSGTATDDITIVYANCWNAAATWAISGGNGTWTKFLDTSYATDSGTTYLAAWWKRATGTDSGNYTISGWSSSQWVETVAVSISGIPSSVTTPVEAHQFSATSSAGTAFQAVSVTTTGTDPCLVWIGDTYASDADTPPTGWTEQQDGSECLSLATRLPGAAGTYATTGATGSHGSSSNSGATLIAVTNGSSGTSSVTATRATTWAVKSKYATRVAVTTGVPSGTSSFATTLPTHAAGDRMVLVVTGKYNTATVPTINQSWTLVGSGTGGTGSAAADTGQTFWAVYAKDAASGSETAPTVTAGGTAPNSWVWTCVTHRLGDGMQWRDTIAASVDWVQSASDTNTASPLTGTTGAFTNVPTEYDALFAVGAVPTDAGTAQGTTTVTCTGLSGGAVTTGTGQYVENALNQDTAATWAGWTDFTGTASAGVALSFTITSASNHSGSLIAVALRQQTALTQVTATRATTWNVIGRITATRATTWDVLTPAAASRATTWDVLTPVTPATRATSWRAQAAVTATRATTWNVIALGQVSASRATTWDVLTPITGARATTWDVLASTTGARATTWDVLARLTAATRASSWDVLTPVTPATRATSWRALTRATATRATTWAVASLGPWPLAIHSSGRYFVTTDGDPYLLKADTPWAILLNCSPSKLEHILDVRAGQGFNAVAVSALGNTANGSPSNTGATYDSVLPFVGGDPSVLNSTYWDRVRDFITYARSVGITVILYAMDGWVGENSYSGLAGSWSNATAQAYGEAVADYLGDLDNVIFASGGDYYGYHDDLYYNVQVGLAAGGMDRPWTMQFSWEDGVNNSFDSTYFDDLVDYSHAYCYILSYNVIESVYSSTQTGGIHIPVVMGESLYEGAGGVTEQYMRNMFGWALTSGAAGAWYGTWGVWDADPTDGSLITNMTARTAALMGVVEGITGWHTLVPDYSSSFITAGRGTKGSTTAQYASGNDYVTGGVSADGNLGLIYHPNATGRQITVNTALLTSSYTVAWVDPVSGAETAATPGSTYQKTGSNSVGGADWFLVFRESSTVPVTATRSTTWDVTATVASTRATSWDVLSSRTATRATTWDVTASVTATRATTWDTLTQVAATRATSWATAAAVSATKATSWDALAVRTATRATTWTVRTQVTATRATTWNVQATGQVSAARATSWDALARVAATAATTWNVAVTLAAVTATRATSWDALAAVSATRVTGWDVLAAVTGTRTTTWTVRQLAAATRATSWDVLTRLAASRATSWVVAAPGALPDAPPERTLVVAAETRTRVIAGESRTLTVPAEARTLTTRR